MYAESPVTPPSEHELGLAIDRLDPIEFQVLAERFARLRHPRRFARLSPVGRNESMRASNTWGDGQVLFPDGRIDVVEATTTGRPGGHLKKDLEAIHQLHRGRVEGFLFVSNRRKPKKEEDLVEIVGELEASGVPADRIDLIFRELLLYELAQPRFAALWPFLGCSVTPAPLTEIAEADIFADPRDENRYVLSREDFAGESLPWGALHDGLWNQLMDEGVAVLRGMRGAGKTVVGAQVGLRWSRLDLPCLYLDLGSHESWSNHELLSTITWRADSGVLFVVDNIHHDERLAAEIHRLLRSRGDRSALLLIGRADSSSERGVAQPLADLARFEKTVKPGIEIVASVLEQELRRKQISGVPMETQPYAEWVESFGGDLVLLLTAIRERLVAISQGDSSLSANDAVDYVKQNYLHPSDQAVNAELAAMAVAGEIEIGLPDDLLSPAAVRHLSERGLAHPRSDRRPGSLRYHLPHPALAALLLTAYPVDVTAVLSQLAIRFPSLLTEVVDRLRRQGSPTRAATIAKRAVAALDTTLVSTLSLSQLAEFTLHLEQLTATPRKLLDETLAGEPERLAEAIGRGTPEEFVSFLEQVVSRLTLTAGVVREICEEEEVAERYAGLALRGGPEVTHQFLSAVVRARLKAMMGTLRHRLSQRETARRLVAEAYRSNSASVAAAIAVSAEGAPVVAEEMVALLVGEGGVESLAATLDRGNLQDATELVKVSRGDDPLTKALAVALLDPACQKVLDRLLLPGDLTEIGVFLYELRIPAVRERCLAAVTNPNHRGIFEEAARGSSVDRLPRFLGQIREVDRGLHDAVGTALSTPDATLDLQAAALRHPKRLLALKVLLKYAQQFLPELFSALLERLSDPKVAMPLAESIVRIEKLNEVTSLFADLYELMPSAARRIAEIVVTSPHVELLVYTVARSNTPTLGAFTRTFELAGEVWDGMPAGLWADACRRPGHNAFRSAELGVLLAEIGHPDLEAELATAAAEQLTNWAEVRPSISFTEMSWILSRCNVEPELVSALEEKAMSPDWLIKRLSQERPAATAELACASWSLSKRLIVDLIAIGAFEQKAESQFAAGEQQLTSALTLVGILSLGDVHSALSHRTVHRLELVNLVERHFRPPFELDAERGLLFLGLAELSSEHHMPLELPRGARQYFLHLCNHSEVPSDRRRSIWDLLRTRLLEVAG